MKLARLNEPEIEEQEAAQEASDEPNVIRLTPIETLTSAIIAFRDKVGLARRFANVFPLTSDTATVPRRNGNAVIASFVAENVTASATDAIYDTITFSPKKLVAMSRVSSELEEDSGSGFFADFLAAELGWALAYAEDQALILGDGSSTYGGIVGLKPRFVAGLASYVGAVDAATGHDTFAEIKGPNHIRWSASDLERLRQIYGVSEKQAAEILQQQRLIRGELLPINKSATTESLPTKWSFTASDGKVDRVGDIIDVRGIRLAEFSANPIWHFQHDYDRPVGMAPNTYKAGGKLKSTLELGIDVFPYAAVLQRALAAGMIRACSVGFDPIRWSYNKSRDGIDFHEISLREISAVTVPCCAGAVLDGPVKSLSPAAARRQRTLEVLKLK